jgi:hypothetical protein
LAGGNGNIDWTGQAQAAVPAQYGMLYYACGTQGRQIAYEVRVNIIAPAINVAGAPSKIVTVSSRKSGAVAGDIRTFAPPVTLRGYSGR